MIGTKIHYYVEREIWNGDQRIKSMVIHSIAGSREGRTDAEVDSWVLGVVKLLHPGWTLGGWSISLDFKDEHKP